MSVRTYLEKNNIYITFFFFFNFLADTCPFWGHWYPCFGFLVTSPLGFKARVGSALFAFLRGQMLCIFPKIHLWCYTCQPFGGQCTAGHFPTCMCRGGTWLRFEWAITRIEDERATIVPATRLYIANLNAV